MIYRDPKTLRLTKDRYRRGFHKRTRYGVMKVPGHVYRQFRYNHPKGDWKRHCEAYRTRRRKYRMAKESRRRNRGTP